jgi:hypothetical protein
MLSVVQNLTLGIQEGVAKMPIWTKRRQLLRFFQRLTTRGSAMDLYVFLSSHLYLLRLALIENFILFTNRCAARLRALPIVLACLIRCTRQ